MLNLYNAVYSANNPKRFMDNHFPALVNSVNQCECKINVMVKHLISVYTTIYMDRSLNVIVVMTLNRKASVKAIVAHFVLKSVLVTMYLYKARYTDKSQAELYEIHRKNVATNKASSAKGITKAQITKLKNGIPPSIIGSIHNLRMTHWRDNISKGATCDITIDQLTALFWRDKTNELGQQCAYQPLS